MHQITIKKCKFLGSKIVPDGEPQTMDIVQAATKFAGSGSRSAKESVLSLRSGDYIGFTRQKTESGNFSCFLLRNNGSNNISSIKRRDPSFETKILEIYLAVDVTIVKDIQELPSTG